MEISAFTIYLLYLVGNLHGLFKMVACVSFISLLFFIISEGFENTSTLRKYFKMSLIAIAVSAVGIAVVPSKEALVAMYVVPKVANSEVVTDLPSEVVDYIRSYIKQNTK